MEQILTIEEEKKYIAGFIKRQTDAHARSSDFSKIKIIEFGICNFISFYRGFYMNIILEDNSVPRYKIEMDTTCSEHLPSFIKINIKGVDGSIEVLSITDANIKQDGRGNSHIVFEVSENIARQLTKEGTKVQLQYNEETFGGEVMQFGKNCKGGYVDLRFYVDMVLIYNENRNNELTTSIFPDEKIDEIYDYCTRADARQRKIEKKNEKSKRIEQEKLKREKIEQLNSQMAKLENNISRNVTPHIIDYVEKLFSNPLSIPEVKVLKDFCDSNRCKSKNYLWLFSLDENYDKEEILEDVKQSRKGCNLFALLGLSKTQLRYKETTLCFIKDFETRFPKL